MDVADAVASDQYAVAVIDVVGAVLRGYDAGKRSKVANAIVWSTRLACSF